LVALEQIVIAIISGFVAVIVAIIGIFRRNERSDEQDENETSTNMAANERLMVTLNRTVEAQADQITILRDLADAQQLEIQAKSKEISNLSDRVTKLERLTIEQALIIKEFTIAKVAEKRPMRASSKRTNIQQGGEVKSDD
jgi:predicted RNase H-like nuclease (RuvC/YqgF family)